MWRVTINLMTKLNGTAKNTLELISSHCFLFCKASFLFYTYMCGSKFIWFYTYNRGSKFILIYLNTGMIGWLATISLHGDTNELNLLRVGFKREKFPRYNKEGMMLYD